MIRLAHDSQTDRRLGYTALRFCLGLNIFFHGLVRFGDNYTTFVNDTVASFQKEPIPTFVVQIICYLLPITEFLTGLCLATGWKTRPAALVGSTMMAVLITGMTLQEEWDIVGTQMIYVIFYAAVLAFREYNYYSLDQKFSKKI